MCVLNVGSIDLRDWAENVCASWRRRRAWVCEIQCEYVDGDGRLTGSSTRLNIVGRMATKEL
jgi:hypothetical protein